MAVEQWIVGPTNSVEHLTFQDNKEAGSQNRSNQRTTLSDDPYRGYWVLLSCQRMNESIPDSKLSITYKKITLCPIKIGQLVGDYL